MKKDQFGVWERTINLISSRFKARVCYFMGMPSEVKFGLFDVVQPTVDISIFGSERRVVRTTTAGLNSIRLIVPDDEQWYVYRSSVTSDGIAGYITLKCKALRDALHIEVDHVASDVRLHTHLGQYMDSGAELYAVVGVAANLILAAWVSRWKVGPKYVD